MRIFKRKNNASILLEPSVVELEQKYHKMKAAISAMEAVQNPENAEAVFTLAESLAFHFANNCPSNFMLRLNHESLANYRRIASWSQEAQDARDWALGAYLLYKIGGGKSVSKEQAERMFESLTLGMTPISGHGPSLANALFHHGQTIG